MNTITVSLPVFRASFAVEVLQRSRLHTIDVIILTEIGPTTTEARLLVDSLGLPPRLIDASVVRLSEEGLLHFHPNSGELRLTDRALAAWHKQELDALPFRGEAKRRRFTAF